MMRTDMFSATFWKSTVERSVRTAAQVLLGFLVVGETGVLDVDWEQALSVTGVAVIASILTSVVATGVGDKGTASLVKEGE
jgi:hypothetical protein